MEKMINRLREFSQSLVAYKLGADFADAVCDAADALENQQREIEALKQIIEKQAGLKQKLADMALELEKEVYRRKKQAEILIDLRGQKHELLSKIAELHDELDQIKAERDAAVKDLMQCCRAFTCKHCDECTCISAITGQPDCGGCYDWEWRGPQKA